MTNARVTDRDDPYQGAASPTRWRQPESRTSASSSGPVGRQSVIVSLALMLTRPILPAASPRDQPLLPVLSRSADSSDEPGSFLPRECWRDDRC
jgi:hypothetical protein